MSKPVVGLPSYQQTLQSFLKPTFTSQVKQDFIFDSKRTSQNFNLEIERKILKQKSLNKINIANGGLSSRGTPDLFEIEMQKGRAKNPFKNDSTLTQNKPDWFETKANKPTKKPIVSRNHTPNQSIANASIMQISMTQIHEKPKGKKVVTAPAVKIVTRGLKRHPEKNKNSTFVFLPNQTDDGSSIKHSGKKIVSRRLSAFELEGSTSQGRRPICRQFPQAETSELVQESLQPDVKYPKYQVHHNKPGSNLMQQIIEQEKARLKQLNKPASKMLFNPARNRSKIDFVADAKAGPDFAKPSRLKNARPKTSMGDCLTHLTQTEPDKEKKAFKVTQQNARELLSATHSQIQEQQSKALRGDLTQRIPKNSKNIIVERKNERSVSFSRSQWNVSQIVF